ncbi:hypothetical protein CAPTEDRAFT_184346 [Capitella teleta]|uniref:Rab-GAP TBC domain-containing protein n=1 Tax=Capitella teleta TaxID=283909 RepID=R7TMA9_CAPTE|nr:hypothetical protein CAPTEDRAFT_184346 [Capitella teleta]|eukprot:ELT94978.1 hypothetical protein CAPTEDRAFT_184346 [Capitella teleta]
MMCDSPIEVHKDSKKHSFWRTDMKSVPGRSMGSPRKDVSRGAGGAKAKDSFKDFQEETKDAWDDGDDDLIQMANIRMSLRDVQHTALQVINKHSQQQQQQEEDVSNHGDHSPESAQNNSAPGTPSNGTHPGTPRSANGPGVGVRLNSHHNVPSATPLHLRQKPVQDRQNSKVDKFKTLLETPHLDLDELKTISWSGVPKQYRQTAWKILSGYLPPTLDRRTLTLERKRQEYYNFIQQYYETRHHEVHQETFRQIAIDIPRMSPLIPIFQQSTVQKIFERILFIWAIRHPASGYVQGINDLVTPFFVVFLTEYIHNDVEIENCALGNLPEEQLGALEADCFWCFSKLLDGIQDNYTFAQPGIQLKVDALKHLISRIDAKLHQHLMQHNVEYLQFTFRWMNNLLMRELPLRCVIRLWDTYMSEAEGFASFHLYVCAAFLSRFSQDLLRENDFHGLMLMLQNLPTHHWDNEEIGLLLAEAYKLKYMFADAPKHLDKKR